MFTGVLALLERSLRIDARSWQTHVARLGLMLGIYVSLRFAFAMAGRFGAPGLTRSGWPTRLKAPSWVLWRNRKMC